MNCDNGIITIKFGYVMSREEYKNAINEIKNTLALIKNKTMNYSEIEKVKFVYDYIASTNSYGDAKDAIAQSAYSAFSQENSPVCAGYAKASQIIF